MTLIRANIIKTWHDSAALLLVARSNISHGKYKILMLKRTPKSKFMPSAYVFPGGVVSATDFNQQWTNILKPEMKRFNDRLKNIDDSKLYMYTSNSEKSLRADLAFRLCSIRETFEESGILLVSDKDGYRHSLTNPDERIGGAYSTLGLWRDKVNEDPAFFLKLFCDVNLIPDVSSLYEWSCALTPSFMKRRFDTIFHMCFLEHIPPSLEDDGEVVHSVWDTPSRLLQTHGHNLPPPQQFELQRLATYNTVDELRRFCTARECQGLQLACPYLVKLKDGNIKTYPGDDMHSADPNAEYATYDMTVDEAFDQSINVHRAEVGVRSDVSRIRCNVEWCGHPALGDVTTTRWSGE